MDQVGNKNIIEGLFLEAQNMTVRRLDRKAWLGHGGFYALLRHLPMSAPGNDGLASQRVKICLPERERIIGIQASGDTDARSAVLDSLFGLQPFRSAGKQVF